MFIVKEGSEQWFNISGLKVVELQRFQHEQAGLTGAVHTIASLKINLSWMVTTTLRFCSGFLLGRVQLLWKAHTYIFNHNVYQEVVLRYIRGNVRCSMNLE